MPPYRYCIVNLLLPASTQCVEYGSESGGVWNTALIVEVCGILL